MISIFFVENDFALQSTLKIIFQRSIQDINVIGFATSVQDAIRQIPRLAPEIVLLDIHLQGGTGFDVLNTLGKTPEERGFEVIFFTVRDDRICLQRAMNEYQAAGYLVKPFELQELFAVLTQARLRLEQKRLSNTCRKLFGINRFGINHFGINPQTEQYCQITHPVYKSHEHVRYMDIIVIAADGDWTRAHTTRGELASDKRLGEWEQNLDADLFVRIHDSCIVNLAHVVQRDPKTTHLQLANGQCMPVARRRKTLVEEALHRSPFGCRVGGISPPPPPQITKVIKR